MFFLTHGVVSMYFLVPRFCNLSYRIVCTLRQRRSAGQCRRAVLRTRRRRPCGAARPRVLRVHGSRCADQGVPAWPTRRHVPLRRMGTTGCPPRRHSRSVARPTATHLAWSVCLSVCLSLLMSTNVHSRLVARPTATHVAWSVCLSVSPHVNKRP